MHLHLPHPKATGIPRPVPGRASSAGVKALCGIFVSPIEILPDGVPEDRVTCPGCKAGGITAQAAFADAERERTGKAQQLLIPGIGDRSQDGMLFEMHEVRGKRGKYVATHILYPDHAEYFHGNPDPEASR